MVCPMARSIVYSVDSPIVKTSHCLIHGAPQLYHIQYSVVYARV